MCCDGHASWGEPMLGHGRLDVLITNRIPCCADCPCLGDKEPGENTLWCFDYLDVIHGCTSHGSYTIVSAVPREVMKHIGPRATIDYGISYDPHSKHITPTTPIPPGF